MNDMTNEPGSNKTFITEYREPRADLKDAIMNVILTKEQQRKAWKRKEKTIMFIYVGAIFFALLFLFFLVGRQVVSPKLRLPGKQDLIVYYSMFIVSLFFSLIAFGVYFVKSHSSNNRSDLLSSG
jgi:uncharacterized BrkB/YihY/UPF0761 family membrane protein